MAARGIALGVDLGTSGVRVAALDAAGRMAGLGTAPLAEARAPEGWWSALRTALAALADQADLAGLRAVAVGGTSGTILPVDAAGRPLAPASLYSDQAEPEAVRAVERCAPAGSPARGAASPLARALAWLELPGLARLLHQADWITGRLLGCYRWSDGNNALKTGYDAAAARWPPWLAAAGMPLALLPEVRPAGTPLGAMDAGLARSLGLPPGLLVVAGTTDGCAAFLAAGAARPGEAVTSLGSTLVLKLASEAPVTAPGFGVYSHRLQGLWLAGGASNSGGAALARHFDGPALARLSARLDPGRASPLDYYPLPGPGERFPIADAALAPRETPRPEDELAFLHGLLEGIARIEAAGYRRLVELGASPLVSVRTVGGGARNAAWTAIRARVLGVPMCRAAAEEAAMGLADLALRQALR